MRKLKRSNSSDTSFETTPKRIRRSDIESFDFKSKCFFCGENCLVEPDPKNPARFRKKPGVLCKTADRGKTKSEDRKTIRRKTFKVVSVMIEQTQKETRSVFG